ncbi:MAG: serine/threonine protein kinase [Bryobacterales bacterium]|nr:serine/threonine protein kinase [Bryobacterales bacterium]
MDRALWDRVRLAFSEALETPEASRGGLLDRLPEGVSAEVQAMLDAHERSGNFLEPPGQIPAAGVTLDRYTLLELVAHGGMGEVYRALRRDSIEHYVAVKVLSPAFRLPQAERYFARERQILAQISHPNVVTLIDDGFCEGRRYLVMEWVDGVPLHVWAKNATLEERLALFVMVCDAVHAAHQHLIVHCDIKPSNILVTGSGQPKLLDFGIARLLNAASGLPQATAASHAVFTLSYSSPEQARNLPAGIPSDIYSLGLVLYELVAGRPAQEVDQLPLDEAIRKITTGAPPRVHGVASDLDAIIRKAAAKEACRRYASALELAGDVTRFRSGYPVQAKPPDALYTFSRFIRRNRAAVAAGVTGLVAAAAALGAFAVQFRSAQHHRDAAERRFQAAREMAQLLVFDVPSQLSAIPGTIETRRWMAEQATRYLERLSKDVQGDADFALRVAQGYRQVATQHFNVDSPNLNSPDEALRNLEQGASILEAVPDPSEAIVQELIVNRLARPYVLLRRKQDALANEDAAAKLAGRLAAAGDRRHHLLEARVWYKQASNSERPASEQLLLWSKVERAYGERLAANPRDVESLRDMALVHKNVSNVYTSLHNWEAALRHDREALRLDEARVVMSPGDPNVRMDLSFALGRLGQDLVLSGQRREGIASLRASVAIRRKIAALDPRDTRASDRLAWMLGELGHSLLDGSESGEGIRYLREALEIRNRTRAHGYGQNSTPALHYILAVSAMKRGQRAEACREWISAVRALPLNPSNEFDKVLPVGELLRRASGCKAK